MSPFPLGPSLGQGSLLRPGGHLLRCGGLLSRLLRPGGRLSRLLRPGGRLSRLLRPGGRLSRLLRPGGRLSRLLRPGGRLSRLLRPGGRLSRLLRPGGRLSRLLRPSGRLSRLLRPGGRLSRLLRPGGRLSRLLRPGGRSTCQSHLTPPLTCQSHLTPPLTCQSHLTPPLTCQSHLTSQRSTQCPFTSLLSRPPCPGGLLSHWPHMDLALHFLPRFHRPPGLCRVCVKRLEAALWGGGSVMNLVATHYNCTSPMDYISHHAHTHSRPPLHQSHSCHHSLINPDCLTTPAPHSLTHIKAAHKHSPSAKSCFPLANISEHFPSLSSRVLPGLFDSLS